jgi:tetratricopeptide (TPR) repeat protein
MSEFDLSSDELKEINQDIAENITKEFDKSTISKDNEEKEDEFYDVKENDNTIEEKEEIIEVDNDIYVEKDLTLALKHKEEGNKFFREKNYDEAIENYTLAINYCPIDDLDNISIFLGNRAAAYYSLEEYPCVIEDCSNSLTNKPNYIKVLMRRCQAYEKTDKIEESLADSKKIKELDDNYPKINELISRLTIIHNERIEKLKDEAMDKLKGLGNSLLGAFGMSLDNFKMNQDPDTGGWSVSMNK